MIYKVDTENVIHLWLFEWLAHASTPSQFRLGLQDKSRFITQSDDETAVVPGRILCQHKRTALAWAYVLSVETNVEKRMLRRRHCVRSGIDRRWFTTRVNFASRASTYRVLASSSWLVLHFGSSHTDRAEIYVNLSPRRCFNHEAQNRPIILWILVAQKLMYTDIEGNFDVVVI